MLCAYISKLESRESLYSQQLGFKLNNFEKDPLEAKFSSTRSHSHFSLHKVHDNSVLRS